MSQAKDFKIDRKTKGDAVLQLYYLDDDRELLTHVRVLHDWVLQHQLWLAGLSCVNCEHVHCVGGSDCVPNPNTRRSDLQLEHKQIKSLTRKVRVNF